MAFVYSDRPEGGRVHLRVDGLEKDIVITVLGHSSQRQGQYRVAFENVGKGAGVEVIREEDLKK